MRINHYTIKNLNLHKNAKINAEFCLAYHLMGEIRTHHDSLPYNVGSDIETGYANISVKASKFTLMTGTLCEGQTTFDGIWNVYAKNTHSNVFAYITANMEVYEMDMEMFKKFVYAFCRTERDSEKNGGCMKIRCKTESQKMLKWLESQAA